MYMHIPPLSIYDTSEVRLLRLGREHAHSIDDELAGFDEAVASHFCQLLMVDYHLSYDLPSAPLRTTHSEIQILVCRLEELARNDSFGRDTAAAGILDEDLRH